MTKQQIWEWLLSHSKVLLDFLLFLVMVTLGVVVKILNMVKKGVKSSWKWFLAEAIISFFVALLVYAFFEQFLQVSKLFTYVVCAWCGSLSTVFHKKAEELLGSFFDRLKQLLGEKTDF